MRRSCAVLQSTFFRDKPTFSCSLCYLPWSMTFLIPCPIFPTSQHSDRAANWNTEPGAGTYLELQSVENGLVLGRVQTSRLLGHADGRVSPHLVLLKLTKNWLRIQ